MYDSADDLQSAGSQPRSPTHESVSEFGDLTLGASSSADTALMQDRDSAMGDTAVRLCFRLHALALRAAFMQLVSRMKTYRYACTHAWEAVSCHAPSHDCKRGLRVPLNRGIGACRAGMPVSMHACARV